MSTLADRLERRQLGATGLDVSTLGLAGSFGIDVAAVERVFYEFGVNYFFVTMRMEGLVDGIRALVRAGHRDEIVIAAGVNVPFGFSVARAHAKVCRALGVD